MRRLLKYAIILALAVAIGAYIVLGPLSLEDSAPIPAEREAAVAHVEPAPPTTPASPASVDEQVAKRLALETAKVERLFLADKAPAPGNPEASISASSDARAASEAALPASPPPQDAVPAMAATAVSTDASQDARPMNEAARPAAPVAETVAAAGTQLAALTPDEICRRDGDRLARLRASPSGEETQRFASELGCEALRPQLQRLMESLGLVAPVPPSAANSTASSDSVLAQVCASERAALDRLRKEPSAEAARLFWRDLKCARLRPQVTPRGVALRLADVTPSALNSSNVTLRPAARLSAFALIAVTASTSVPDLDSIAEADGRGAWHLAFDGQWRARLAGSGLLCPKSVVDATAS